MPEVKAALQAIIDAGGTILIVYDGGSAPGTARPIAPISISGEKLVARCLQTSKRKTFILDKVRIVGVETFIPRPLQACEDAERMAALMAMDLLQLFVATTTLATNNRWALTLTGDAIYAHRDKQTITVEYRPTLQGLYFDCDDGEIDIPSERPWCADGRLFIHKCRAFAAFQDALLS